MVRQVDGYSLSNRGFSSRFSVQRSLAELLGKRWMDAIAPVILLIAVIVYFAVTTPSFTNASNLVTVSQTLAEYGFLALAMTIVISGGGIDLSVGGIYAVTNAVAVILFKIHQWPTLVVLVATLVLGSLMGLFNGVIISVLRTRPFITTLVTLLLFRSIATYLDNEYSPKVAMSSHTDFIWEQMTVGRLLFLPPALFILLVSVVVAQIIITRTRFGWQIIAMGSSRTAARRAGMKLSRLGVQTYVLSGLLSGFAGFLVATRLSSSSQTTGAGYEFVALTAVIIGGINLYGGRGTAIKALLGATIVAFIYQGLLVQGFDANAYNVVLAIALLLFAAFDIKYGKNRGKVIQKIFLVPSSLKLGPLENINAEGSVWKPNRKLTDARPIGLGQLDGPEDVILDEQGRIYCGDRRGWIWRFEPDDLDHGEVFCRVGGLPLGLAWDADKNLVVCVGGMGVYSIDQDGNATAVSTQTDRNPFALRDTSAIRLADDLDIAPDGKIYYSDASTRFDGIEYNFDVMEARPNGRVMVFDPATGKTSTIIKNMSFPNGVCVAHDGQSVLICSTILSRVDRLWIAGEKEGTLEPFLENLPGLPDNINRAGNGEYWLAFAGMRTPTFDLALQDAGFRRRMLKEIPQDEWLIANMNTSCVVRVSETGEVLESLWDETQMNHALITSMREKDGYLYLGGLVNNRMGRYTLPDAATRTDPVQALAQDGGGARNG
ncbi:ABC transporter permease [Cumulibacter soli]|uniref:ABC transporter permease n=1 Tax=Cumulibacter soli TaxID=2546344 RepID=UPI00106723C3|nr:SMP-30/gluconolactonase/LRE family protein [Cumulibacter soli]